jgi:hypothetical protein
MGKKQVAVSLRKPPPPADPDTFVAGSAPAPAAPAVVAAPPPPPPTRSVDGAAVSTRVGERRELTIYLPPDLARTLSVRCVELDRDVSNMIAETLTKALESAEQAEQAEEPVAVVVPADRWTKARALLGELRARFGLRFGEV